ncbi:hypothetical protein SLEP1_g37178 [Rubroshorea leprosula]|uniref:Uncharacterized protein n=1 Tax=Rubroshorea leprosula TaxID=152421 RepID=A0AAV5KTR6_9ROSI|nr:hypothetical protein SLEP1_g37178 [Rubroshorea leprosula]
MKRSQDNREATRHKENEPLDVVGVIKVITVQPSTTPTFMALAIKGSHESQPSTQAITFTKKDLDQMDVFPHDPLTIEIMVEDRNIYKGKAIKHVLVDIGSCRDVMRYEAFKNLGVSPQLIRPCNFPLVGFSEKSMPVTDKKCNDSTLKGLQVDESAVVMMWRLTRMTPAEMRKGSFGGTRLTSTWLRATSHPVLSNDDSTQQALQ